MNSTEKGNIGEDFVNEIAFNSFIEHWCYPSPKDENGDKEEICDLLILFGDKLIIISVKNYEFKDFYSRYFRRTIDKAVKQIYGAERKLLKSKIDIFIKHPKRDIERFPKERVKEIHRVIVNLGEEVRFYPFNKETKDEKFITLLDKEVAISNFQTQIAIVDGVNEQKQLFHFVISSKLQGIVKYTDTNLRPKEGDFIKLSYGTKTGKDRKLRVKVLNIEPTEEVNSNLRKDITGLLEVKYKNYNYDEETPDFAFVGDYYVPKYLLEKHQILDDRIVKATAIYAGDKWKVTEIEEI